MKTSEAGLALIREFEGFRAVAYRDPVGVWTIGFGHTKTAKEGMTITLSQAVDLLREDVKNAEQGVEAFITAPLDQNQFDALVSWAFNVGVGALERSTLRRKLNAGDYDGVPAELMRWTKAGGRELKGLVRRRRAECALWRGVEGDSTVGAEAKPDEPALKPIAQSKSLQGATTGLTGIVATGGGLVASVLGALASETAQIIMVCGLLVAAAGVAYAMRDRWLMRVRGER